MTDSESVIVDRYVALTKLGDQFFAKMKELDAQISKLSVERDTVFGQYSQVMAQLRDLEVDLEWVQAD